MSIQNDQPELADGRPVSREDFYVAAALGGFLAGLGRGATNSKALARDAVQFARDAMKEVDKPAQE